MDAAPFSGCLKEGTRLFGASKAWGRLYKRAFNEMTRSVSRLEAGAYADDRRRKWPFLRERRRPRGEYASPADAIEAPTHVEDKDSGELRRPHHVDLKTGMYRGRQVLKVKSEA